MEKHVLLKIFIFIFFMVSFSSCSQPELPFYDQLQKALDENLKNYPVKGTSVAIIMPGGETWLGVSGISHDSVRIKPDMYFAIGSITKNVVAALTFKLAEQGILSLDDALFKWLPSYPKVDSTITIRQLLHHTSGLFMFWDNQKIWDDLIKYRDKMFTPEEILTYLKEPYFPPGRGWRYSNTNYLLLAMIIKRATGSNLSTEFRKYFWEPLNIKNVSLSVEQEIPKNVAHVWGDNFENDGSFRDITFLPRTSHESITYGSSGLFMTAKELAVWCHSLFAGKVLKKTSMDEMSNFNRQGYGLGVHLINRRIAHGVKAYGHGGGNIGTTAYMAYLSVFNVSIVVMINAFHGKCYDSIMEDLIEIVTRHLNQQ
ncbi:MAG: beta-lactamase family protein [bacterium]|jgi:D-alanyl-D-alanine carboxypeptidase|nr:beta-lactamase family protein [bacterium]